MLYIGESEDELIIPSGARLAAPSEAAGTGEGEEKGRSVLSGLDWWLDSANPCIRSALLSEAVSANAHVTNRVPSLELPGCSAHDTPQRNTPA